MEFYTAIDIGSYSVKLAIAKKEDAGDLELLTLSQVQSKGVVRGIIYNISDTTRAIKQVLGLVKRNIRIEQANLVCNINGQHMSSERFTESTLLRNFRHVFIQMTALKNVETCLINAGLTAKSFVPESIASLYAIKEDAVIVLNFGYSVLNVSLKYHREFHHLFTIAHFGNPAETIKTCASEILSHHLSFMCSSIVLCGGLSYDEQLFVAIRHLFPSMRVKYVTFSGFGTTVDEAIRDRSNGTVLGLLKYASYNQEK